MFKIEDNVPFAVRSGRLGEATKSLSKMKVGQSFEFSTSDVSLVQLARLEVMKQNPTWIFRARTVNQSEGIRRLWRLS